MHTHQLPLASDWYRLTSLYSVRFIMDKPINGVINLHAIWSTDRPPQPRTMAALQAKYREALDAFLVMVPQTVFETGTP